MTGERGVAGLAGERRAGEVAGTVLEEAEVDAQHFAILDAFRQGDGEAARAAIITHLESVRSHLLRTVAHARAKIGVAGRPKKR